MMSDMIENRIETGSFNFKVENVKYEKAGHQISGNANNSTSIRHGKMMIEGKEYKFSFGGTGQGDLAAQKDARRRVFQFLSKLDDK